MKIALVSLPGINENDGDFFPLGVGYLVSSLKPNHDVKACHFNKMIEVRKVLPDIILKFKPQVVGITCSSFNRGAVREVIRLIKNMDESINITVGGVHASFCYDHVLTKYGADVVVIGEGELTFAELCHAIEKQEPLKTVRGIAYIENKELVLNPPRAILQNLDDLMMPDYSYAKPFIERTGMAFLITSRGCPVRCTFCSTSSFWGQQVRTHSVARVVDEMEMLLSRYSVKKIFFHDDTFNLGIARVKALCDEIIKRGVKVEWGCSCRVVPVSEDMIASMVEAGCRHICWGVETGSEAMLRKINKRISLSQIRNAYDLSKKFSGMMSTGAFAMVGNPGENDETIHDTIKFFNSIPMTDHPSTSKLYILPGTLLYEELRNKRLIKDEDWSAYDTVPYYTVETSSRKLSHWAMMINKSGKIIPFDQDKHFWHAMHRSVNIKACSTFNRILDGITRVSLVPQKVRSLINEFLPAGKIRF